MKKYKCIYAKECELSISCSKCDLHNYTTVNKNIMKQIKMDSINKKDLKMRKERKHNYRNMH